MVHAGADLPQDHGEAKVDYNSLFRAIDRRDDTYYIVSFSGDHLLLPGTYMATFYFKIVKSQITVWQDYEQKTIKHKRPWEISSFLIICKAC